MGCSFYWRVLYALWRLLRRTLWSLRSPPFVSLRAGAVALLLCSRLSSGPCEFRGATWQRLGGLQGKCSFCQSGVESKVIRTCSILSFLWIAKMTLTHFRVRSVPELQQGCLLGRFLGGEFRRISFPGDTYWMPLADTELRQLRFQLPLLFKDEFYRVCNTHKIIV